METLNSLIKKASSVSGPETIESAYMDLMESLMRHIAVVSIAAYKNNGFRQKNIDFQITRQLTAPSMGSWKNIIEMLSNAGEKYFSEQFYQKFLLILGQKITDPKICKAFTRIEQLLEFASTETSHYQFARTERACTAKQFFQKMVEYRNRFVGHGTGSRPEYLINSVVVLRDGVIGICNHLKKLWRHYPIYLSAHDHLAGQTYCKMTPLSQSGNAAMETPNPDIKPGMLYICLDTKNQVFETVFPLAIWHDSDKKEGIKLIDTGLSGYTEDRHPALHSDIPCAGEEEAMDAFEYASPEQLQHGKWAAQYH